VQEALRSLKTIPGHEGKPVLPFITTKGTSSASREQEEEIAARGFHMVYAERLQRSLESGTTATAFKFTAAGDFIAAVRNASSVMRAGVTMLPGLTGPLTLPKQTGPGTATWRAENPGSALAVSDATFGTVTLSFKTIQSTAAFTRQALFSAASGNYSLDDIVRQDLAAIIALGIDLGGLNGLGSSNQPLGILQDTNVGAATALGAQGGTMAWTNWVDLETKVGTSNASGLGRFSYLTNAQQRARAKNAAVLAATASGVPIWGGAMMEQGLQATPLLAQDGIVNGYPAIMSNQVPSNLTKGTTGGCSAVVFGAFEHLLLGIFGNGFELITDPYSRKGENLIEVTAWSFVDFANRYPIAFATIKDAL
jgi:HK97 family phage major capsid protein